MTSKKCSQCGLVNFADASHCKRCHADLQPSSALTGELSRGEWPTPESSDRFNSKVYLGAVGVGLLLEVASFVLLLASYPNERSKWLVITMVVIYALAAGCFSAARRVRDWLLTLSLSSFYLLGLSLSISELLRQNETYGGWFWTPKFYWSPVLLMISIPLGVFLGARFGSKRSMLRFAALISVVVVASVAMQHADTKPRPAKELNYSTDIVADEPGKFAMRLELTFRVQITDDPMRFRFFPSPPPAGGSGGWNVTVLRKDSNFSPDIRMTMNVDGKEIESSMWPINSADGSSHVDFSRKHDFSDIVKWRVGPGLGLSASLATAHHITLTWGNVTVVLPDEQVESLRTFARNWGRMRQDEGMLCTNPSCKQGIFNP